jgi:hypothetical protein
VELLCRLATRPRDDALAPEFLHKPFPGYPRKGFLFLKGSTMITFEEFERLASTYSVVPPERIVPADLHTPVTMYLALREGSDRSFLLESAEINEQRGRYSFAGTSPLIFIVSKGRRVETTRNGIVHTEIGDVVAVLRKLQNEFRQAPLVDPGGFSAAFWVT